jgi:hypothetical protein
MVSTLTKILYFIFAIVMLASIGVSLPYCFDTINHDVNLYKNLNQNLVTYYVAILVSASLDYIIKLFDDDLSYKKPAFLIICIVNSIFLVLTGILLYDNSNNHLSSISYIAISGVAISYIMWWLANFKNPSLNAYSATGGVDPNKPLTDGNK